MNLILELSGKEGFKYRELVVTGWKIDNDEPVVLRKSRSKRPVRLYVEVIGMEDKLAPSRNWGDSFK